MADRPGRGRLSSIDQLPSEADDVIKWASNELLERKRTQADILFELNDRLEAIGCETLSRSAFNRYSTRKAAIARGLQESSVVAREVVDALGPDKADNVTVLVVQLIKQAAFEILEKGNVGSKALAELGRALSLAVSAQNLSMDTRRKLELENAKLIASAVDKAGAARGLTPETVEAIKASILGIRIAPADAAAPAGPEADVAAAPTEAAADE